MNDTMPETVLLTRETLDSYRQIAICTFRQTFDRYNSAENMASYIDAAYHPAVLEKDLDPNRSAVYLAQLEGQTVGYLKLNFPEAFTHPVEPGAVEIERIYVDEAKQGRRIGVALMQKAIDVARNRDARFIWLGVWEKNDKAKSFYEKKGFVIFGSHPFMLGEDRQTDLLMRLDLESLS